MTAVVRTARSHAAPAGRNREAVLRIARPLSRSGAARPSADAWRDGLGRALTWTRTRTMPLLHVAFAALFLVAVLLGTLVLRTQMVQNSFEAADVQSTIVELSQDVEDDQARLDALDAALPRKAQEMGMVPQQGVITVDLNGYRADGGQSR